MNDIRPLYLATKLCQAAKAKPAGRNFKGPLYAHDLSFVRIDEAGTGINTETENTAIDAVLQRAQANLPDHLLQTTLGIREIGSVDVQDLHGLQLSAESRIIAQLPKPWQNEFA